MRWAIILLAGVASGVTAQTPSTSDSAALPLEPTRTIEFTTHEGTWVSLDVSPDGSTIILDLLGDLYTMPIDGGRATRVTTGWRSTRSRASRRTAGGWCSRATGMDGRTSGSRTSMAVMRDD